MQNYSLKLNEINNLPHYAACKTDAKLMQNFQISNVSFHYQRLNLGHFENNQQNQDAFREMHGINLLIFVIINVSNETIGAKI